MNRNPWIALMIVGGFAASGALFAQALAGGDPSATSQGKAVTDGQKPPSASQPSANPFPEDTSSVPVIPLRQAPPDVSHDGAETAPLPLPGDDLDPVRSPDDPEPAPAAGQSEAYSSSLAGRENLLPSPDDDQPGKKGKLAVKEPAHKETASKDIEVGGYYLQTKNWRAALSRFESAVVLDPENPDVYWGLAEANRHLGNLADARANYQKVADYDPDSRHGKDAVKALKEPEIANGKNAAVSQTEPAETPK